MRRIASSSIVLVALVALVACGDEPQDDTDQPVTPPAPNERNLPTVGAPQDDEHEEPPPPEEHVPEDPVELPDGECCPVTFALAPSTTEVVQEVVLRGSLFPLDAAEGVALQESDGVWSGEACLAPDQVGIYHYELSLETEGDEPFLSQAHNPYAPTAESDGEIVNALIPADDCEAFDAAIHAQTSE
jgi:hypothetical protein